MPGTFRKIARRFAMPCVSSIVRLLSELLIRFVTVWRNAHQWRNARRDRTSLRDLPPVEHVLKAISKTSRIPRIVLHFENNSVVTGSTECHCGIDFSDCKCGDGCLALLERADNAV